MTRLRHALAGAAALALTLAAPALAQTAPAATPAVPEGKVYAGPLMTKWGKAVTPENAWRSYPRPQMVREAWQNLNGLWDYAIVKADAPQPTRMDGKILVPFAVESQLSGVQRKVLPEDRIWYRRSFAVPAGWAGKRTLLHFGAVDFEATVWVNGALVGSHKGGSDPFAFDVSRYLKAGDNALVVQVADPTSAGSQPRGKQTLDPRNIWYTAVSGIWQTVWLEPVPDLHIQEVRATPDIDKGLVAVQVALSGAAAPADAVKLTVRAKGKTVATAVIRGNRRTTIAIPDAHLWSPEDPFLYDLEAELVKVTPPAGRPPAPLSKAEADLYAGLTPVSQGGDKVASYFGMRKTSIGADPRTGKPVLLLNNKFVFQNGVLDQGWWPDGLLTPPSEEAAKFDMVWLKKAGFNMLRKHIKVEPARYYYDADRLGMLIWQDMPSGGLDDQAVRRASDEEAVFSSEAAAQFQLESTRIVGALRAFPSIVTWVTNNEGWGQYDARTVAGMVASMDPSRPVDATTGWLDVAGDVSAMYDIHTYEEVPLTPEPHGKRALVLGEYGGVGLLVPGHIWFPERTNKIYQTASDKADYLARYKRKLDEVIRQYREAGVSAAVYTQTTDVEGELNGMLTYDREVEKLPAKTFADIAAPLKP
ncbi:glycoside hydrolase family 2 TIM barrel-domain containing protein [Sphingomonas sp. HITSZ_GF]|uniref:glycoside hydrolase family 2 protein n=1 Tax=Sphingomonas sp. HITSZ_GF TaxID=3037247 RepID=UPI00240D6A57|nr:sugar-binding domain-containing protein [Sphingomonas sp. HITSZ_GF]MDG2533482.1 glycoside hydrolase family 2 TIM barrel-domain containing protein [Sphingomonas sp. HITSZ_GF]